MAIKQSWSDDTLRVKSDLTTDERKSFFAEFLNTSWHPFRLQLVALVRHGIGEKHEKKVV